MKRVQYQMQLTPELDGKLHERLREARRTHDKELSEMKLKDPQPEKELAALKQRGRRITIHNLIRVVLAEGLLVTEDPQKILALLAKHGVPIGRPNGS